MTFLSRLKRRFWPVVPDPANSSIKRWTSESTQVLKSAFVQETLFLIDRMPYMSSVTETFHSLCISHCTVKDTRKVMMSLP